MGTKNKSLIVMMVFLFIASFALVISSDCFAQAEKKAASEEIPPRKDYTGTLGFIPAFFERGKVKSLITVTQGVDNNVYLDPRRATNAYTQVLFKTDITSPINSNLNGILGYEVMNLNYENGAADQNLLVNTLRAGSEYSFCKNIKLYSDMKFAATNYYTTGDDDSLDYSLQNKIKQNLPEKMYHSFSHEVMYKSYTTDHTRGDFGVIRDRKRKDLRNTYEYEIGKYFAKDLLKFKIQYYINDSNDKFMNYYDYSSTKPGISFIHLFNDKTFSLMSYSMQYREFNDRTLTTRADVKEKDVTQVLTAALYRNLTKDLTLGMSYSYRHNKSNEPTSKYSGSLWSVSAAYSF